MNLDAAIVTAPTVIVSLRARGISSDRTARRKLEIIAPNAACEILQVALNAPDVLQLDPS